MKRGCTECSQGVEKVKGQRVDATGHERAGIGTLVPGTVKCLPWSPGEMKSKIGTRA